MKWLDIPAGTKNGAEQRLWVALGDNASAVADRINSDDKFVEDLARFAVNGGFQLSTSQKEARRIMGRNFFGIEEAIKFFGVKPSKKEIAHLAEIPWSEEVLAKCADTHVLVAVFQLSILDIRGKVDKPIFYSHKDAWYNNEKFAKDKGEVSWRLVRKKPVADSTNKTWNDQQVLLSKDEETLKAQAMVYTIVGHFLATGERLFENVYVRCIDLSSDGYRVIVGLFDSRGLGVHYYSDGVRFGTLGLSSARKLQ
jgi:hypothetical protein